MCPYFTILGRQFGTYGLCMVIGIALAMVLSLHKAKQYNVNAYNILIVGTIGLGCAIFSGSLLYCFVTYDFDYILDQLAAGNFQILVSGIVFYGGLIGGLLGAVLGRFIAKCSLRSLIPVVVPYIPLGHAIGRVGCVMAGCCYGMKYEGPFAIHYPHSVAGVSPEQGYFPVQPLESLMNVIIAVVLIILEHKLERKSKLLFYYLGMYAIARFILEYFRGDAVRGIFHALSTSQWISIGMLVFAVLGLVYLAKKPKEA